MSRGGAEIDQPAGRVALDRQHRMDDEMDAQTVPRQLDREAVDQERHVVIDDLDHGVGRLPAVLLELGVVDTDLRLARRAFLAEAQLRQCRTVEIERVTFGQIFGRDIAEVGPYEPLGDPGLVAGQTGGQLGGKPVDDLGLALLRARCHVGPRYLIARDLHKATVSWRLKGSFEREACVTALANAAESPGLALRRARA